MNLIVFDMKKYIFEATRYIYERIEKVIQMNYIEENQSKGNHDIT